MNFNQEEMGENFRAKLGRNKITGKGRDHLSRTNTILRSVLFSLFRVFLMRWYKRTRVLNLSKVRHNEMNNYHNDCSSVCA